MRPQTRTLHARLHDERETQDNGRGSVRAGHRGVDRRAGNCISIGAMNRPRVALCNAAMARGRVATTSQPYWTILPPWGPDLTIPRKQGERVSGARPCLPPGSTSWTSSMAQAASAPKLRPEPPSQHQDSPVRREPGGARPPTPWRGMWPPLPPGCGGRRLSRSARVR